MGIIIPACDGLIAATALCFGLHIMTQNVKHFRETGAFMLTP
jgi:predicted nucleic acid-binding protein